MRCPARAVGEEHKKMGRAEDERRRYSNGAHEAPLSSVQLRDAFALKHGRHSLNLSCSLEDNLLTTIVTRLGDVVTDVGLARDAILR